MTISFDNQVAIVTGAGGGLGRAYALELARRGARVLINDLGGATDGTGSSNSAAAVAQEIEASGGEAIANGGSVTDEAAMNAMVQQALDKWGRVDVFIANAGILRDRTFAKMDLTDYRAVIDVHLIGTVCGLKAAWPIMREQQYGRIVVTSSGAGLHGNFGQTNYSAAKLGLVGLMKALKSEGEKYGIRANAIAPGAATRMTEALLPEDVKSKMVPEAVAPGVVYLCSEDAPNGTILNAQAGFFSISRIVDTQGHFFADGCSAEDVQEHWDEITDPEGQTAYTRIEEAAAAGWKMLGQ